MNIDDIYRLLLKKKGKKLFCGCVQLFQKVIMFSRKLFEKIFLKL